MSGRQRLILGWSLVHLWCVALGAAEIDPLPPPIWGRPGHVLTWYRALTQSDASYGFFCRVGPSTRITFALTTPTGLHYEVLGQQANREVALRLETLSAILYDAAPKARRAIAASLAAAILARHPAASQVLVRFEEYVVPSLATFATAPAPQWQLRYWDIFTLGDTPAPGTAATPQGA